MPDSVTDAVLPARSLTVPAALWPKPSPKDSTGVHDPTPESASAHSKLTETDVLFQPAPFGATLRCATIVGAVRSTFTGAASTKVAMLPARSVTEPCTICPAPSPNDCVLLQKA